MKEADMMTKSGCRTAVLAVSLLISMVGLPAASIAQSDGPDEACLPDPAFMDLETVVDALPNTLEGADLTVDVNTAGSDSVRKLAATAGLDQSTLAFSVSASGLDNFAVFAIRLVDACPSDLLGFIVELVHQTTPTWAPEWTEVTISERPVFRSTPLVGLEPGGRFYALVKGDVGVFVQSTSAESAADFFARLQLDSPPPPPASFLGDLTAISSGGSHTCGVTGGLIACWGSNWNGQLGDGTTAMASSPKLVKGLEGASTVSAGSGHTCAIVDGRAYCWGSNEFGQLGDGSRADSLTPVRVGGLGDVTAISAGYQHTCAVADGRGWCWGDNDYGQLGDGSTVDRATPTRVKGLKNVTAVSADGFNTCAVANGKGWCWGKNDKGQLGNGERADSQEAQAKPVRVKRLTGVTSIETENGHTCAIADAAVWCWGSNASGQLGNGEDGWDSSLPDEVIGVRDPSAISLGSSSTCALASSTVWCWGRNASGELGDGTTVDSLAPVRVRGLEGVSAISFGGPVGCAIVDEGAWCWGWNWYGNVGDGTRKLRVSPRQVVDLGAARVLSLPGE